MIKTATLLVLGAGASKPYSLPLTTELNTLVYYWAADINTIPQNFVDLAASVSVDRDDIFDFATQFRKSALSSIDRILTTRPELIRPGKATLAYQLLKREKPDHLHPDENDWYAYLWQQMHNDAATANDVKQNKLRIITFNYDRSLEAFLYDAIRHSYPTTDEAALNALRQIPILHVYGSLGAFGLVNAGDARRYQPELTTRDLQLAFEGIKVMPEARTPEEFKMARQWFDEADRVAFLGFGFDELNCERLDFHSVVENGAKKSRAVFATAMGLKDAETKRITKWLFGSLGGGPVTTASDQCRDALREWGVLF